jgi:AAA+ ATPase superfamily predicted ATPase
MVRLTKETHLCHCLCATSDCLFIEDVYSNARLEGRAKYLLVDDLEKETAFRVYKEFGFEDEELVWEYIGGKIGDMVSLFEEKMRGLKEREAIEKMFRDMKNKLEWIKLMKLRKREDGKSLWEFLTVFRKSEHLSKNEIEEDFEKLLFWIEENVLFYNPVEGTVQPQSRLLWRVIKEVMSNKWRGMSE